MTEGAGQAGGGLGEGAGQAVGGHGQGAAEKRKVTHYGEPGHETDARVERENIPEDPEEGVTYRDVKVDWSVAQRIVHPADAENEEDEAEDG